MANYRGTTVQCTQRFKVRLALLQLLSFVKSSKLSLLQLPEFTLLYLWESQLRVDDALAKLMSKVGYQFYKYIMCIEQIHTCNV